MSAPARALTAAALLLCAATARAAPPEPAVPDAAPEAVPAEGGAQPASPPDPATALRERLAAREHELAALRGELERLKARNAAAALPVAAPPTLADPPPAAPPPGGLSSGPTPPGAAPAASAATDVAPPLFALPGTRRPLPPWQVETAAALGALVLGFGLGWRALDRRIRRKYGGLRIY